MKVTLSQSDLSRTLSRVNSIVPSKSTLPILSNILLTAKDGFLTLTASDLNVSITSRFAVEVKNAGSIAIPAQQLTDLIKNLPSASLELFSNIQYKLTVQCEQGNYKLSGEPEDDFPALPAVEDSKTITVDTKILAHMVNKTIFAVSNDSLTPSLTGILFHVLDKKEFRLISTDKFRFSKLSCKDFETNISSTLQVVVPTKVLQEVAKSSEGTTKITFSDSNVCFDLGDTQLYSRIIDEKYPDYERILSVSPESKVSSDTDKIVSTLKRISIVANPITHQIRLSVKKDAMEINAEDVETGNTGTDAIPVEYGGEPFEIGFNAQLLITVLSHIDTNDVVLNFSGPQGPCFISPAFQAEKQEQMMLAMPTRLNE